MGDQPAIQTEGLSKRFGDIRALEDLNLIVSAGSVLGLLGPNGAGKTTSVRILTPCSAPTPAQLGWPVSTWSASPPPCGR
jgi:ABC-2 type transport system ATP-binding protein